MAKSLNCLMMARERRSRHTRWPANHSRGVDQLGLVCSSTRWVLQLWRSLATSIIGTNPIRLYQRRPKWPGWILLRWKRVSGKRLVMCLASLTTKGLDKSDLGVFHPTSYQSDDRKIHNISDNDKLFVLRSCPAPVAPVPPPLRGPNAAGPGSRFTTGYRVWEEHQKISTGQATRPTL